MNEVLELSRRGFHSVSELIDAYDFSKLRIRELYAIRNEFPEPYKTYIYNIIVSGTHVPSGTIPDVIEKKREIGSGDIRMDTDAYFGKDLSVYPKLNITPDMEGWMCDCGATPLSNTPFWRWNGCSWEHYHGYPIGHVLARKIEKCCGNYPMFTKFDNTVKLWCSSCNLSTELHYFCENHNGIGNMIKEWNSFQKKQEAK